MKNKVLLTAFLVLFAATGAWGDGELNRLHLDWVNNEVVLQADVSETFQFRHEIAEAKDGKPFRVVIDLFPVIFELSEKKYADIPACIVSALRGSQYAANPTATSRIVLDLNKSSLYRIEKKGNSVFVYIPDSECKGFATWTSQDKETKNAQPVKAKNVVAEKPVKKSGELSKAAKPAINKPTPVVAKKKIAAAPKEQFAYVQPSSSGSLDQEIANWDSLELKSHVDAKAEWARKKAEVAAKEKAELERKEAEAVKKKNTELARKKAKEAQKESQLAKQIPAEKQLPKQPEYTYSKPESSSVLDKAIAKSDSKPKAEKTKTKKPVQKKAKADLPVMADSKVNKEPVKNKKTDNKTYTKVKKSEIESAPRKSKNADQKAELAKADSKVDKKAKATSRFRRKPAFPNKLKGTIVAEFPKRMVIKYKPASARDPFATLINEQGSGSNDLIVKTIPDVETSRLVGVLQSTDGKNRALLEDMDGVGYILKTGDKVKKGYISKIYSDKAFFQLFEYGWSRTIALRLNEGE